ncbi:Endochitinase PR4 [Glycine soja]|uniref:chitinase n=1 Tax=Glycine soja TaxID=3848 RepID=A0A0B2PF66_GLYSO|nr:Endochitinase PR4 [Glycine soja]
MMGNKVHDIGVTGVMMSALVLMMVSKGVRAQNCGCEAANTGTAKPNDDDSVADIVTPEFFNAIIDEAEDHCAGKNFYSRDAFLDALIAYNHFARTASSYDSKREIAAAFAHFTHETRRFCYLGEIEGASKNYCGKTTKKYPCAHDKGYHGREPIQLSWNFNYAWESWIGYGGGQ